jgi:hypothetical protein
MGLKDVVNTINNNESGTTEGKKCPSCQEVGTNTEHWYSRCGNGDCDTITFIPTGE